MSVSQMRPSLSTPNKKPHHLLYIHNNSTNNNNNKINNTETNPPIEFRSKVDDAWYTSTIVLLDDTTLVVKLHDFPHTMDEIFSFETFKTFRDVDMFVERFRPISEQLQDLDCGRVTQGLRVCASYKSNVDDVRYFDASVDSVHRKEHVFGKEVECTCEFLLSWLHGANEGNLTNTTGVANICIIEPFEDIDNRLAYFSNMVKKKIKNSVLSGSGCVDKAWLLEKGTMQSLTEDFSCSSQLSIKVKQEKRQFPFPLKSKEEAGRINKHHEFQDIDFTMAGKICKCPENSLHGREEYSTGKDSSLFLGATIEKYSTLSQGKVRLKDENGQFLGSSQGKEGRITECHESKLHHVGCGGLSRPKVVETSKLYLGLTGNVLQAKKDGKVGRQFPSQTGRTEGLCRSEEPEKHHFMLVVDNLEKDLSSSTIVKFIQNYTSTSPQAYVFPSLSSELYTRGVIETDSEKKLKQICMFINNPGRIVTSSKGRPWVTHEEPLRRKNYETTVGGVTSIHQERSTVDQLKVVHRGDQEYRAAKRKRDLFLEFAEHQKGLHKKLALEEKKMSQLFDGRNIISRSSHTS